MSQRIIILGAGPAGYAAAVGARSRGKEVLILGNRPEDSPLAKSELIDNYPGLPGLSGLDLLKKLESHAVHMGADRIEGRVSAVMAWNGVMSLTVGSELYQADALILAVGIARAAKYPGEERFLGRGVSYCATCDGMLYRGKRVIVTGRGADVPGEANFLHSIGCQVTLVGGERPPELDGGVGFLAGRTIAVEGEDTLAGLSVDGESHPCDGVFILRPAIAPTDLLPGLALTEDGMIAVDRQMRTNLPGVYAAGDCTGRPYQVAKAVGEGLVAGEAAAEYLDEIGKGEENK